LQLFVVVFAGVTSFWNVDQKVENTLQIFRGLAYIHNVHGVSHRDIKPQNLLVCRFLFVFLYSSDNLGNIIFFTSLFSLCAF